MSQDTKSKVTTKVVDLVAELTEVRAEIARLEKIKSELTETLNATFDEAGSEILVHRNLEVARRDWRTKTYTNELLLKTEFPEVFEATRKETKYSVIVSLYHKHD